MILRDYQDKMVADLRKSIRTGHKAPILVACCGSGKTVIAGFIAKGLFGNDKELLFLVNRQELYEQTELTFRNMGLPVGDKIKIGMIITVSNHLSDYNPDYIIADECSFALARTWRKVFDAYPNAIKIGLSATPIKTSGEPMGMIFDDMVYGVEADELIKQGYLSPYSLYAPKIDVDLSGVKTVKGDYDISELEERMSKPKIYGDVIKYYTKLAHDKKTIVYCTSINHSRTTTEMFREAGYKAEHIDGATPNHIRKSTIEKFRNSEIQVLCNVDLISFGFDCPSADCVCLLRPTQSVAIYVQQACRVLRKAENKEAIILDFVGNVHRFGMPTEHREYTLDKKITARNISGEPDILARQCGNCYRVYAGTNPICPYCNYNNGKTRKQIEQDEQAELERIEAIKRKDKRREERNATTLEELIKIGQARGYKNAVYWARMKYKNSWRAK